MTEFRIAMIVNYPSYLKSPDFFHGSMNKNKKNSYEY